MPVGRFAGWRAGEESSLPPTEAGLGSFPCPRWPIWLIAAYLTSVAAAVGAAMWLDLAADRAGRTGMEFLRPLFAPLVANADTLRRLGVPAAWILPGSALGIVLYLLFTRVASLRPRALPASSRDAARAALVEAAAFGLLTLVVVAYRFYALNRIPNDFIGELVFQVVCTSDWRTTLAVNGGAALMAPWAPLGIFHYLLTGAIWRFSGSTVLTLCFASAVASVLLLQVHYWFVRHLGGPLAALIAAAFYAASPLETVWGRHAMQPFNYPSIIVLLVALATFLAVTRGRLVDWLLTVVLMALSHQSFGSAYGGFLIPIGAVFWLLLFDRKQLARSGWKPLLLVVGVVLWLAGPALALSVGAGEWHWLSPFDPRLDSRAFRGAGWSGSLDALVENVKKIVGPLYVGKRGATIQNPTTLLGEDRLTFLSPAVVMLLLPAAVWMRDERRRPAFAVLLSLVAAAVVPGLISTADPHRLAAAYPALCAIAGMSAATALDALQARFAGAGRLAKDALLFFLLPFLLARSGALYFSQPEGEPPSVVITRSIKEQVEPGTLLVLHLPYWLHVDVAYLLFDDSLVEPFGWMFIPEDRWEEAMRDFRPRFDHLFHNLTALHRRVPELERTRWRRVVFVIDETLDPAPKVEELRRKYGRVTVERVDPQTWRKEAKDALIVVKVDGARVIGDR